MVSLSLQTFLNTTERATLNPVRSVPLRPLLLGIYCVREQRGLRVFRGSQPLMLPCLLHYPPMNDGGDMHIPVLS